VNTLLITPFSIISVNSVRGVRRKEKAIESIDEMKHILQTVKHITIAMCEDNVPYLVTLSHGYDPGEHRIYFHCASEGKKIDILKKNNVVWGQALVDEGYIEGACDHLYATTQFKGKATFIEDFEEKKEALQNMIRKLDSKPKQVEEEQLTEKSINRVTIGRIDIEYMSGKKSKDVIISL
jgi:nitroimidazol reductase NimA-like FMN-containing flavoprotein (pyridoxamine 5'-phosphate oxidase superfamily)